MATAGISLPRVIGGVAVTACGLAHFAWPRRFEALNRKLGFTHNTRLHVFVNGGLETVLGLTLMSSRTRTANVALSIGYPIYLTLNVLRARLR
ncbi:hypothetical protein [Mycobacterium shimoidei]|uniref:hypothetical protein n=1 Tax=Mycobacterium shimoidei TaxID=29313 RepID=UPI00084924B6|nr:hypothetical protein [Mycobacterium shimoidei]MCV7257195.1 hypothetical protein [Mycobacterium shimoidei]ODR14457.1 hypothetical protein BHQ16_06030 [Mycobacterium shimoidei]ORW80533.1 hypothetical protein AWC26_11705 [Mycobacterium shimoidei]